MGGGMSEWNLLPSERWNPINCKKGWKYGREVDLFKRMGMVADSFSHYFVEIIIFAFILLLRLCHMFKQFFFFLHIFIQQNFSK